MEEGEESAIFCDSWEIDTRDIWDKELDDKFISIFGYNIKDHLGELESNPETFR